MLVGNLLGAADADVAARAAADEVAEVGQLVELPLAVPQHRVGVLADLGRAARHLHRRRHWLGRAHPFQRVPRSPRRDARYLIAELLELPRDAVDLASKVLQIHTYLAHGLVDRPLPVGQIRNVPGVVLALGPQAVDLVAMPVQLLAASSRLLPLLRTELCQLLVHLALHALHLGPEAGALLVSVLQLLDFDSVHVQLALVLPRFDLQLLDRHPQRVQVPTKGLGALGLRRAFALRRAHQLHGSAQLLGVGRACGVQLPLQGLVRRARSCGVLLGQVGLDLRPHSLQLVLEGLDALTHEVLDLGDLVGRVPVATHRRHLSPRGGGYLPMVRTIPRRERRRASWAVVHGQGRGVLVPAVGLGEPPRAAADGPAEACDGTRVGW
mmetsp:Transcript_39171/g.123519  ORF Transcript_39171/g.123519 Transcript_39171/m.123519 type:complete len:382 (-) Transcript_39171:63-1208(-)